MERRQTKTSTLRNSNIKEDENNTEDIFTTSVMLIKKDILNYMPFKGD